MTPLLSVRNLDIAFGSRPTVSDVSFDVHPGETVAVVGESGSGKSTTAMSLLGLLPGRGHVTGGTITLDGQDVTHLSPARWTALRGSVVGLVPQDPMSNFNPVWTIGRQVGEALRANGLPVSRVPELLEEAGLPDARRRMSQYPHQFSGGMRQRALIAAGLAARPKLLIADEPTSALDVTVQRQILDHLADLTAQLGTAVLLITHDLGLAAERAERIVVMSRGRVVETGPALEVLRNPQHEYTRRLVAAAPSVRAASPARPETPPVVEVENLTKTFGGFTAAKDVSFQLRRGQTLALVGESGSGKSTVAQMVLGLLPPTSGRVLVDGADVTRLRRKEELAFRRRVQPVFQNPYGSIDPMYSMFSTIVEPLRIHRVGSRAEREARVRELLDMVALPQEMMHRFPGELSGGQRQRVAIARALALDPEVLILDEAVSALDVLVQAQILDLLADLQARMGLTYLFITHDLAVVKQIADETLVMRRGEIVERGLTDELFADPQDDYTRRLLDSVPGATLL
ncbi:ABC transporter ATP-binding protein [Corynebacterium bovis]|uniref:ABC transporter ATP-binding protein n=1 Tax=Corynebacterium bovis TaxID=36808 RepID=UPI003138EBF5